MDAGLLLRMLTELTSAAAQPAATTAPAHARLQARAGSSPCHCSPHHTYRKVAIGSTLCTRPAHWQGNPLQCPRPR